MPYWCRVPFSLFHFFHLFKQSIDFLIDLIEQLSISILSQAKSVLRLSELSFKQIDFIKAVLELVGLLITPFLQDGKLIVQIATTGGSGR